MAPAASRLAGIWRGRALSAVRTRALFVNSGILGMQSFSKYIREAMAGNPEIDATHINLSEDLSIDERLLRRAMCVRMWRDGWFGLKNLDFARLRHEYHAGVQAARRMRRLPLPDVVHYHRQATAYASVGLMRRVPAIVSIDCTQDAIIQTATSALERWTYRPNAAIDGRIFSEAAAIVSTSEWAVACVRRRYPDCGTPMHVMQSPVRIQFFDQEWVDARRRRTAPDYLPRVLFVGGDFVRKGGDDLLEAWRAGELYRYARLDLVSDWPGVSSGVLPGVQVHRHVVSYSPEWAALWRAADIFAMPTRTEAFGLVYQEAAAAGLPRIGTRLNAVPELIADGESGLTLEPEDPEALGRALLELIRSSEMRDRFGRTARAHVLQRANPDDYRTKLTEILMSAAHRGASAPAVGPAPAAA